MKVINKKVYYCDFCKKHGLSGGAMSGHEKHCTLNRKRECRICNRTAVSFKETIKAIKKEYKKLITFKGKDGCSPDGILGTHTKNYKEKMDAIMDEWEECPMCFFTALRLSGNDWKKYYHFSLEEKVEEYWKAKYEEEERQALYL